MNRWLSHSLASEPNPAAPSSVGAGATAGSSSTQVPSSKAPPIPSHVQDPDPAPVDSNLHLSWIRSFPIFGFAPRDPTDPRYQAIAKFKQLATQHGIGDLHWSDYLLTISVYIALIDRYRHQQQRQLQKRLQNHLHPQQQEQQQQQEEQQEKHQKQGEVRHDEPISAATDTSGRQMPQPSFAQVRSPWSSSAISFLSQSFTSSSNSVGSRNSMSSSTRIGGPAAPLLNLLSPSRILGRESTRGVVDDVKHPFFSQALPSVVSLPSLPCFTSSRSRRKLWDSSTFSLPPDSPPSWSPASTPPSSPHLELHRPDMSAGHITVPSLPEVALPGRAVATPRSTVSPGQCTGTAAETMNVTFDKRITEDDGQHRNIGQPTDFPTGHEGNADLLGEKYNRKSESEPVSLPSSTQMPDQSISLNTTAKLNGASEKLKVHHRRHISLPPDILQYKPEAPSQESENPVEQHVENECANASLLHVNSNRAHHLQLIYHMLRHAESVYGLPLTVTSAPAISLSKLTDRGIICKRTGITQNNILMAEFSSQPFCPAFYVAVDTAARAIVICVRGTAKFSDSLTDVAATHDPVCVRMRSNQYGDRIKRRQSQYSYRRASTPLRTRPNSSQSSISSSSLSSTSLGKLSPASSGSALGSGTGFGRVAGSTPDPSLTDETAGEPLSHPSNNLSKNVTISSTNDNGTFIENHPNDVKADSDDYIEGFGHAGIVQSARNLVQKVRDCVTKTLSQEEYQGYAVITTGHSLGAGTASVLALILREEIKLGAEETPIFCVAFAPPPCLTYEVADAANKCTLTVVNGPDVVPRLSVAMLVPLFATARYVADLPRHKKSLVGLGLKGVAVDWDELYNLTIERMGHLDRLHDGRRLFLPGRVLHITRTRKKRWRVRKVDQGAEEEKPSKINKRADVDSDPTDNNFDDSFGNDGDEEDTNDDDEMMEEGLRDNGNGRVRDEEMKRFIFTWLSRKRVENKERDRKSPSIFSRKWRPNYVACVSREPRTKFLNIKRREKGMFLAHAPFSYRAVLSQALRNFDESPVPAHGIGQVMTRLMSQDMSSADVWTELCNQGWPEVC